MKYLKGFKVAAGQENIKIICETSNDEKYEVARINHSERPF